EEPDAGVGHFHDQIIRVHAHHRHPAFTHRGEQHIVVFLINVVAEEDHKGAVGVEVVVKPAQHRVQPSLSGCGSEPIRAATVSSGFLLFPVHLLLDLAGGLLNNVGNLGGAAEAGIGVGGAMGTPSGGTST